MDTAATIAAVDLRRRARKAPRPAVVALLAGVLAVALAAARDFGPDGFTLPLLGLLVVAGGLAPGLVYLARLRRSPERAEPLPYLPLLGLVFAVYYGLPVLVRDRVTFMSLAPSVPALGDALELAVVGLAALYAGFGWVGPRVLSGAARRPLRAAWDEGRARTVALVLVAVGSVATAVSFAGEVPGSLVQVVRLLALMLQVGIGIFLVLALRGCVGRAGRLVLWLVVVPAYLFVHLRTGQIGAVVRPLVFTLLLVWAYRCRLPWIAIGLLAVGAILLRGAAGDFREQLRSSAALAEKSPYERSALYVDVVRKNLGAHPGETVRDSLELVASRTAQLGLLAHTVHRTPEAIPYWGGETYKTLASSFVPRFVWRDKPTKELGQRFGHRYGVLEPGDRVTSVNLPQLVELFVNFGPLGVLLGMLGLGVLYRFAYYKLNDRAAGDGTILIGAVIFSELVNIESDFSLVFGGLVQVAVVLYVVLRTCAPRGRSARPVAGPPPRLRALSGEGAAP